ncbi:rho-associated protein kinase 2-like [Ruditapes philippinarum]|uniref:rho-associated protein kinase 2-like n=1 Tax=Ruditapes philippinarum TaxID=129788 RepID=UPI00295AE109|nr:rho-associated protein kinase 2-like [Ruditapes philippinarum]XP_060598667.1 rho-associated protein kinase 2-like [Ruditapes philippinarum]
MGNVPSVKLKEENAHLEINEKLVQDFQYHIKLVDHSMAAFARTTNSLRESSATVKQNKTDGNGDSSVKGVEDKKELGNKPTFMTILETIDEALSDQSFIFMDSLSRLLSFIIEIGKGCGIITPDDAELFTNKYKSGTFADVSNNDLQYHDALIESMRKKLKRMKESLLLTKSKLDNLNDRECHYQEEIKLLKRQESTLDTRVFQLKQELENIRSEKNSLEMDINNLKEELSDLKIKNETLMSKNDECLRNVGALGKDKEELQKILNEKQSEAESLKNNLIDDRKNTATLQENNAIKIKSLEEEKQKLEDYFGHIKTLHSLGQKRLEELMEEEKAIHATGNEQLLDSIKQALIEYQTENQKESRHETLVSEEGSKINEKLCEVSKCLRLLDEKITKMNEFNNLQSAEIKRLSNALTQSKLEEDKLIRALNNVKEQYLRCEEERAYLKKKVNDLETNNTALEEVNQFERCLKIKEEELKTLKLLNEDQIKRIAGLDKCLSNSYKLIFMNLKLLSDYKKRVSIEDGKLLIHELFKAEITRMKQQSTDIKLIEDKTDVLQTQIEEKDRTIQGLQTKLTGLSDENKELTANSDALVLKLHLAQKQPFVVQVHHHPKFKASRAEKEVYHKLQLRFNGENIAVHFTPIEYIMKSDTPVIVLCQRQFGMNRDKDLANVTLSYIDTKMNKFTALILFHNKDHRSFKKEEGGKRLCRSRKFCDVYDIIYDSEGICQCGENSTNIDSMFEFIKKAFSWSPQKEVESAV